MDNHTSLELAIQDGTLTREEAFCGLDIDGLERLVKNGHAQAKVLIRLRSKGADGRMVISAEDALDVLKRKTHFSNGWNLENIRDIMDFVLDVSAPEVI